MTKQKKKQTNKQNKKEKKPSQPQQQQSKPKPKKVGGPPSAFLKAVCSLTNPFCKEAIGSRLPDDSYTKSIGWSSTNQVFGMSSNAAGTASYLFTSNPLANLAVASVVGSTATFVNMTANTTPPTGFSRWRATSWGIRIRCIAPPLSLSGTCRIRVVSPMKLANLGTVDIANNMVDYAEDIPLHRLLDKDAYVIPMKLGINALQYNAPDTGTTIAAADSYGWQTVMISIQGAPASVAILETSTYYNYEFVFDDGNSTAAFAQPPPPDNPVLRNVANRAAGSVGNVVTGLLHNMEEMAIMAATRAAGAYFGGSAGSAAALALTVF